jgi:hypothetical protein
MLQTLQSSVPDDLAFHRLCGLLVACFGIIYTMIAENLERYRPQVWVAVVGKAGVFAIFAHAMAQGTAPTRAVGLAVGDLLFGLAFLAFLLLPLHTSPTGQKNRSAEIE